MKEARTIAFSKWNGLGNDFVIIDGRDKEISLSGDEVRALAARDNATTKGCDQLLIIHPPRQTGTSGGDVFMQIFNADGSEVEACGNGARAVARYFLERDVNISAPRSRPRTDTLFTMETLGGNLRFSWDVFWKEHEEQWIRLQMPPPTVQDERMRLHPDLPPAMIVTVGNPHAVFIIDEAFELKIVQQVRAQRQNPMFLLARKYGRVIENHSAFPNRVNVNFARLHPTKKGFIDLRVWERGVGLTKACGTGACATSAAFHHHLSLDQASSSFAVSFSKGPVGVIYEPNDRLWLSGPAAFEFDGEATL